MRKGVFNINWTGLNKEIDEQYGRLAEIKNILKQYAELKNKTDLSALKKLEEDASEKLRTDFRSKIEEGFTFVEQLKVLEKKVRKALTKCLETRGGDKSP